ncbi:aminotransferase class V-fold PLP-dependent enzyme [Leptolyngbya sp. 7M]|uniref:aminotransferase class V-fold PLP-dependent enzyme n=1 Tax=Leptolyngbya sp. 7M TaxID=2812896 RepID=UPI001B8B965D|nr:aminotransferase class V-fold PLP-dependent enzyme [Leptolyngbya sp. 7M]QYO63474.1 aminotransferase class V-fold PLP-dependent enzyme [Leptolyngbya sp. 7M]
MSARIYLDNAATSFPKPEAVHQAMIRYATQVGGTAGRGNYAEAREGARVINQCRQRIADFVGAASPDHVIFTLNTTDALNLAIKGVVIDAAIRRPGEPIHVVTTELDHNSILRPLHALREQLGPTFSWTCLNAAALRGEVLGPIRVASEDALREHGNAAVVGEFVDVADDHLHFALLGVR